MTGLTFRDRILRLSLFKALMEHLAAEYDGERQGLFAELRERYDDEGTKSWDYRLPKRTPNPPKIGSISLAIPKAKTEVTDDDALLAWAREHAPELVRVEHYPAVPRQVIPARKAWTEETLDRKRVTELLARVKPAGDQAGPVVDTDTGVIVDGVTWTPEGEPKSFSIRFEPDGRDTLARAWRSGELEHLTAGSILPALPRGETA